MNIVIIDDDRLVSLSLKTILESTGTIHVSAMGSSGTQALALYREHQPDVLLMDIRMEGMSGIEAGEHILKEFPDARILYLTTFTDDEYIARALAQGARGYLLKQDFDSIAPALEAVMRGMSVFGERVQLPSARTHTDYDFAEHGISGKEREIMELVAQGMSNREIAGQLFLGEGTVRNYISTLLDKLSLRDRTQLAVYYYTEVKQ